MANSPPGSYFKRIGSAIAGLINGVDVVPFGTVSSRYLGVVASRCHFPDATVAGSKEISSRSRHRMIDNTPLLAFRWDNACVAGGVEVAGGGTMTITSATLEYPEGTFQQITFSGSSSAAVATGGYIESDLTIIAPPTGATFFVKSHVQFPGGMIYHADGLNQTTGAGEYGVYASTTADITNTPGTVSSTFQNTIYRPSAILGMTNKTTWLICGDSRARGAHEISGNVALSSSYGFVGEVERSIGKRFAFINVSAPSERVAQAVVGSAFNFRKDLGKYCSHIISEYGINDFSNSISANTTIANQAILSGFFPGKPFYLTTISPNTTSTDSWATTVNQTVAGSNTQRVIYNNYVRNGKSLTSTVTVAGYAEVADVMETSRDSGIWNAPGWTDDGLHAITLAYVALQQSEAFDFLAIL